MCHMDISLLCRRSVTLSWLGMESSTAGGCRSYISVDTTLLFPPNLIHSLVMASFEQIDREKVIQFERRAHLYREVQKDESIINYNALELKVKAERKRKVHRSAVDMDGGWISKFLGDND